MEARGPPHAGGARHRRALLQCATTLILVFSGINWSQTIPLAMMQFVSACTLLAQWDKSGRDHMYVVRGCASLVRAVVVHGRAPAAASSRAGGLRRRALARPRECRLRPHSCFSLRPAAGERLVFVKSVPSCGRRRHAGQRASAALDPRASARRRAYPTGALRPQTCFIRRRRAPGPSRGWRRRGRLQFRAGGVLLSRWARSACVVAERHQYYTSATAIRRRPAACSAAVRASKSKARGLQPVGARRPATAPSRTWGSGTDVAS